MDKEGNISCEGCGATLKFKSGTSSLCCEYCGYQLQIQSDVEEAEIEEFGIDEQAFEVLENTSTVDVSTIKCTNCAAETTLGEDFASKECPFCSTPLVIQQAKVRRVHKPQSMLPFETDEKEAFYAFQAWIKSLWFAPSALRQYAVRNDKLQGVYIPFWTYDCSTTTRYTGRRGKNYTVSGPNNTRSTQTRWSSVSGTVMNYFDDVLVPATNSVSRNKLEALEPWDIENLKPYDSQFLVGFKAENYQITLRQGFSEGKKKMARVIRRDIKRNIGGDKQSIRQVYTQYDNTRFKHILLPCWVSAYRFNGKTYQFLVNARTAEVQGERPVSWVKVIFTMILVLGFVAVLINTDWKAVGEYLSAFRNSL